MFYTFDKIIVIWFTKQFELVKCILMDKAKPTAPLAELVLGYQGDDRGWEQDVKW